ncbi:hypothetical protein COCOBI_05-1390 [Coccomyxa sp. Obi]|nr:hypothetical protein COCOBI_05-1390 [Coccomyxa sp. Obi]
MNGALGSGYDEHRGMRRNLLQDVPYQSSGPVPLVSIEFARTVLAPLSPGNNITRVQQDVLSGDVTGTYVFDSTTQGFLSVATQSGTTFRFLQALLIYLEQQTPSNVPPHVVSRREFLPTDSTHPTIVKLSTEGAASHVPLLGLRFDYQQFVPGLTPYISLYYTDKVGTFDVDGGLPLPCLTQTYE